MFINSHVKIHNVLIHTFKKTIQKTILWIYQI